MKIRLLALTGLLACAVFARESRIVSCEQGGHTVSTFTYSSSTKVQQSYPSCTISVYITGSGGTLATLYSDNSGTAMSNPFTATSVGLGQFFADNGTYDITMSGGGVPTFTLGAQTLFDIGAYYPHVVEAYEAIGASGILESQSGDASHVGGFQAAPTMPANLIWQLPRVDALGCWQSNGALVLSIGPCPASGLDTQVQYNKLGIDAGDSNFTWGYTNAALTINGLVSGSFTAQANAANTAGGYLHLKPITYPVGVICLDIYGNQVNQPAPIGGDSFSANDAVLWVSRSPLAGVGGCATALSTNSDLGLNLSSYLLAMGGLVTTNNAYNSIQSWTGGAAVRLGLLADQALYLETHASSAALNTPSANCVIPADGIPNCYGALAYQGGSKFWYWNNTLRTWNEVDFSGVNGGGGSPGGNFTNPYSIQFNLNSTFGGVAALTWDNSLNSLDITTLGGAGLAISNGYGVASLGFLSNNCTTYNCFQAVNNSSVLVGGMAAASFTALNYMEVGTSTGPPTNTTGDTSTVGRIYYDKSVNCFEGYGGVTPSWACLGSGGGGGGSAPYTQAVVAQSSVSITAATHGEGTLALAACFSSASPTVAVACAYTRDVSGNLAFTFSPAFTGTIEVYSGSGGGGGTPGTPLTSIQFNSGGSFAGSAKLEWNGTAVIITTTSNTVAGLAVANGFVQADGGFLGTTLTCTNFNCIQAPGGGMTALSFTAANYIQSGQGSSTPSVTTSDSFHPGALYYDTSSHCEMVRTDDSPPSWTCLAIAGGSGSPGGGDTNVQYNNHGLFGGSGNFVWNNTSAKATVNGLLSASGVLATANTGNTAGGYLHLTPITYPNLTCLDIYGNIVNQPAVIGGDTFGASDAVFWVSGSPLAGVGGCATALPTQQAVGVNTNAYLLSMVGFASTNNRYNSFDAAPCRDSAGCAIGGPHGGGMHALSFDSNNYVNLGQSPGNPTLTPGSAFHPGAAYWDTVAHCLEVYNESSAFACIGGTGGSPAAPFNAVQYNSNPAGSFAGSSQFTYVSGTGYLNVPYLNATTGAISPVFNSTASGGTIAFQTSTTTFQVDGNGDVSMIGQLNLNSGAVLKVNGTVAIDASRNASFAGLNAYSLTLSTGAYMTGTTGGYYAASTGSNFTFSNNNGLFEVNGLGYVSAQNVQLNGGAGTGLDVANGNTSYNSIQSTGGFYSAGTSSTGWAFTIPGVGIISNTGKVQAAGALGTDVGAYNINGGYTGQSWTITFAGGISGIAGCSSGLIFRGGILVSCF
jgi:hypothetical protein